MAPGQFELAPMFERSNVAADHQQLLMVTLKRVAQKHGMECLFHEKPFEGINGSGKHVNFSLGNSTEGNLLLPGDTPHDNAQFLVFCAAVIRAVHKYGGLLRASVASATNDHRLGANEAPPAIISIFLGDQLTDVFDQIAKGGATTSKEKGTLEIGVDTLPVLPDRPRRPQPHQPVRLHRQPLRVPGPRLAAVHRRADGDDQHHPRRGARLHRHRARSRWSPSGTEFNAAVQKVLEEIITDHGKVVFNGDGYTDEWQVEAAERGLPNLRTTLDALPELITEESMELFSRYGVFNHREMHSRYEIALEQYILSHRRRGPLDAGDGQHHHPARGHALPDRAGHQRGQPEGGRRRGRHHHPRRGVGARSTSSAVGHRRPRARSSTTTTSSRPRSRPSTPRTGSCPAMDAVRAAADALETLVADDLWPLPTYQEMLFIL